MAQLLQAAHSQFGFVTVTIAQNAAVSGELYAAETKQTIREVGFRGLTILKPQVWDDADIGFEASLTGGDGTWFPLYDEDNDRVRVINVPTNAARWIKCPADVFGIGTAPYVRLVSLNKANGADLNQTQNRIFTVLLNR